MRAGTAWPRSVVVVAVFALAGLLLPGAAPGQQAKIDAEQLLARLGFSTAEISQMRAGQAVTRLLPHSEAVDVGLAGAVRIQGKPDRLVYWLKQIVSFRKAVELGVSARLSNPPQLRDFASLTLTDQDLAALKACRPGDCALRLGDKALARYQSEVNWSAPDASERANLLTRQLMLQHAQAYLAGGDAALGASHNEKAPRVSAQEFQALYRQAANLYELAPSLATFLEKFPAASLPGAEHFLYWGQGGAGSDPMITLHQMVITPATGGGATIVDKQLYSTRHTDAAIFVISVMPASDATGYYAVIGGRARASALAGRTARLLRGRVESATRDTANMYLKWLQDSMALAQ